MCILVLGEMKQGATAVYRKPREIPKYKETRNPFVGNKYLYIYSHNRVRAVGSLAKPIKTKRDKKKFLSFLKTKN